LNLGLFSRTEPIHVCETGWTISKGGERQGYYLLYLKTSGGWEKFLKIVEKWGWHVSSKKGQMDNLWNCRLT